MTVMMPNVETMVSESQSLLQWHAVHTASRHEKSVAKHLQDRAVQCFLPLYSARRKWKDRRVELELPLFPGYLFVRIGTGENNRVVTVPGVARIVSFGGMPVPIPEAEIEALQRCIDSGVKIEAHPYLNIGKKVRVKTGPLEGVMGLVTRKRHGHRIVLSVDCITRSIAVEVDSADLEPCS